MCWGNDVAQVGSCPVTAQLKAYLTAPPDGRDGGVWDRSQAVWNFMSLTVTDDSSGAVAHVILGGTLGLSNEQQHIDFILVRDPTGGVVVDDTQCTAGPPSTSLYQNQPGDDPQCP